MLLSVAVLVAQVAATPDPVTTYGPWIGVTTALGILWKLHLDSDSRERAHTDKALAGWDAQTEGNDRLADRFVELEGKVTRIESKLDQLLAAVPGPKSR